MAIRKIISRSIGVDVIAAEDLADGSVQTAEIQNGAVTGPKLADNLNYDSGTLYLDSTNNRVGIGTTSPGQLLQVESTSNAKIRLAYDATRYGQIGRDSTGHYEIASYEDGATIKFGTVTGSSGSTNTRMIIDASGNVGIGETNPSSFLHLKKSDATTYNATATDGQVGIGPTIYLENPANSNITVGGQIVFGMRSTESQARIGATGGANPELTFGTNDAERMRLTSDGELRVGNSLTSDLAGIFQISALGSAGADNSDGITQGMSERLDNGPSNITLTGTTDYHLRLWNNAYAGTGVSNPQGTIAKLLFHTATWNGYNAYSAIAADTQGNSGGRSDLVFLTGSLSEKMRLTSGGNLLFNRTSDLDTSMVAISQPTGKNAISIQAPNTSAYMAMQFYNSTGTRVGYIQYGNTSTVFSTSSDYRLKENVVTDWDATTRLKQLNPVRFNFIADADTTVDGFLAHEVSDIVPEAISGTKDAVENIGTITDQDNNVIEENVTEPSEMSEGQTWTQTGTQPIYQGIDQGKLVPLLVKSLQEALTEIDSLKARLDDAGL